MPHRKYHHGDPRRYIVQVREGLGRRGAALLLFGFIWVLIGVQTVVLPAPDGYTFLNGTSAYVGVAWIITGIGAASYAHRRQGHDAVGFLLLYLMPMFRVFAYGFAFLQWLWPGDVGGTPRGIIGATSAATIMLFIILVAGWGEPPKTDEAVAKSLDGEK